MGIEGMGACTVHDCVQLVCQQATHLPTRGVLTVTDVVEVHVAVTCQKIWTNDAQFKVPRRFWQEMGHFGGSHFLDFAHLVCQSQ